MKAHKLNPRTRLITNKNEVKFCNYAFSISGAQIYFYDFFNQQRKIRKPDQFMMFTAYK